MREVEAIILAGGNGSRMKPLTNERQKCLLPIEDKPVLGHILDSLVDAFGSVDVKIGIAYKGDQVVDWVLHNKPNKVDVTFVPHENGTEGWGIYKDMREHVKGDFIAMPGDVVALPTAYEQAITVFQTNDVDGAITLSPDIDNVDTHGVGKIKENKIVELQWPVPPLLDRDHLRDMTIWASDKRIFNMIEAYPNPGKSIGFVFKEAIEADRPIAGSFYDLPWIHLGYMHDLDKPLPRYKV